MMSLAWFTRAALCALALASAGCGVATYQRGRLAHPTMDPDDGQSPAREHMFAVHEGAVGGHVGAASGCGCN